MRFRGFDADSAFSVVDQEACPGVLPSPGQRHLICPDQQFLKAKSDGCPAVVIEPGPVPVRLRRANSFFPDRLKVGEQQGPQSLFSQPAGQV